jgi:hypothetical protein
MNLLAVLIPTAIVLLLLVILLVILLVSSARLVRQYEQGIVFRFGRILPGHRGPGRSVIGRADLDTLLSDREQINTELKAVIDGPTPGHPGNRHRTHHNTAHHRDRRARLTRGPQPLQRRPLLNT